MSTGQSSVIPFKEWTGKPSRLKRARWLTETQRAIRLVDRLNVQYLEKVGLSIRLDLDSWEACVVATASAQTIGIWSSINAFFFGQGAIDSVFGWAGVKHGDWRTPYFDGKGPAAVQDAVPPWFARLDHASSIDELELKASLAGLEGPIGA